MIHVLEEFDGEANVEVLTADDFLTRCYEIGLRELTHLETACIMRVIGKPELSNAIKLQELKVLMDNFVQAPVMQPPAEAQRQQRPDAGENQGEQKGETATKRKKISELVDSQPLVA